MHRLPVWIILIALVLTMGLAGCTTATAPDKSSKANETKDSNPEDQTPIYPQAVMQTLEVAKTMKVGTRVIVGDETFIIASFGPQPTAGYEVICYYPFI